MMSDKTLQDLKLDAHIAVLHTKVDALIEKQKELTQRVRANEKVVAAIGLLGSIALVLLVQDTLHLRQRQHLLLVK